MKPSAPLARLLATMMLAAGVVHCSDQVRESQPEENVVEHKANTLVITKPTRAAFIANDVDIVDVEGSGATRGLLVNGAVADVAKDGTFHAKVHPTNGINVVAAVDGDSRVETSFIYGKFAPVEQAVPHAVAVEVGPRGLDAPLPAASLSTVANLALEGRNLVGAMAGKSFDGTMSGATWKFDVTSGQNGPVNVALTAAARGAAANATVADVVIDGRLSIKLGLTVARDVRITVSKTTVTGNVEISVDDKTGALGAAMPNAEAALDGFHADTDNLGVFPCCADTLLSKVIRGKIQDSVRDALREQVPELVKLTLDGNLLPKEINLSKYGVAPVPLSMRFDGSNFDETGGSLTAAVLFGGKYGVGTPGAKVPGWLTSELGYPKAETANLDGLGISLSLDAVNQFFFAAWAPGTTAIHIPSPVDGTVTAGLPPVVSANPDGSLRVGLGEILVQRADSDKPLAAASLVQNIAADTDGDDLVLLAKGEPTISLTWLTDGAATNGKTLIVDAAKSELKKYLDNFHVAVPKINLDKLGGGLSGKALKIGKPTVGLDAGSGRLRVTGALSITP